MIRGITEINFPEYATLSSATIVDNEMGDKTIETTVAIDASVVPDFSYDWEIEFKGERYIQPLRVPQGNKSNESIKAHIDLTFQHKTIYQLKRFFFFETASVGAGTVIADKYEASVYLNLGEFVTLFNEVLSYYFGSEIVMDLNPAWQYSDEKVFIEISSSYIWDVLQKVNELFGVRWKINGGVIYVGYDSAELTHVFEYGFNGGLMKLERQVQDPSIRNQLLGRGGSKNLPQYYFKVAPEGSGFTSDPDACPELQYVYFDELRGKTFRDYVKGWNAKHYGGKPMEDPTYAYLAGYNAETFSPIEYVEDPISITKYGVLQGLLESNEDIYPSIKGRSVPPYGRIDEIIDAEEPDKDNYDQEAHAYNDSKATILTTLRQSITVAAHETGSITLPKSEMFTVPEGKVGTIESWAGQWSGYYYMNGQQKDAKGLLNYDVTDFTFHVYDAATGHEVSSANIPAGTYYFVASGSVTNASGYPIYATLEVANIRLVTAAPGDQGWKYTFDIWVKNIWQSTQEQGESDEDYAHRVWSPILGSHGEEARVLFDSGWLYGHEDWEFPIISVAKDQTKTRGGIRSEWRITLKKCDAELEATGKYIPSSEETVQAHAGDYFHFIGIDMPFIYVEMAEADLDEYKTQQLAEYSEIKPTWVVTMDHVRMQTKLGQESETFYEQLESGALVYIKNAQFTDNASIAFYLESVTYTWSSDTVIIPNVEVVLSDKVKTVYSPVSLMQGDIRSLNSQVGSLREASVRASVASASMYLPKDGTPAISVSPTTFAHTVTGSEFQEGLLGGADWGIYRDENGKAIIEADKVVAREQLVINDLTVNQITYQGGMQIISAASMECIRVDDSDSGYICYFDQKQGSVANLFQVGDVAYSQIFNEENQSLKYYKRKVEGIGSNYIVLSKTVVDGDGVPVAGDNIIQYGSYTDANRRFVIIRDVIGGGYERMISGLDSVTATGKEYYYAGKYNHAERWFIGDKGADGQYAEYINGELNLKAIVNFLPGSQGLEDMDAYKTIVSQLGTLQYLKDALGENTTIAGGLILSSLIQLGYTDPSQIYHIMAGISGQGSDPQSVAAWFGGAMDAAKTFFRFDGSGQLADGNITWDTNGYGQVGGSGQNYAVKWDRDGIHLGPNITLGASDKDVQTLLEYMSYFEVVSIPGVGNALKLNPDRFAGFFSEGFISANGASLGNGGGGGASTLYELSDVNNNGSAVTRLDGTAAQNGDVFVYSTTLNKWYAVPQSSISPDLTDYATKVWVNDQGFLTAITKQMVEAVLTGTISSHTHNYSSINGTPSALKNPNALTFGSKTYDGSAAKEITKADLGLGNVENKSAAQILAGLTEQNIYALLSQARRDALDSGASREVLEGIDSALAILDERMGDAERDIDSAEGNITSLQEELARVAGLADKFESWFGFDASKNMLYIKPGAGSSGAPADRGLFTYGAVSAGGASTNTGGGGGESEGIPHVFMTQEEYDALEIKDPGTLYFTYEEE